MWGEPSSIYIGNPLYVICTNTIRPNNKSAQMFILGASQCGGNGHFKTDASVVYIYTPIIYRLVWGKKA